MRVSSHIRSSKGPFMRLKRLPLSRKKETSVSRMGVHKPGKLSKGVSGNRVTDRRSIFLMLPALELTRLCINLFSLWLKWSGMIIPRANCLRW